MTRKPGELSGKLQPPLTLQTAHGTLHLFKNGGQMSCQ